MQPELDLQVHARFDSYTSKFFLARRIACDALAYATHDRGSSKMRMLRYGDYAFELLQANNSPHRVLWLMLHQKL
jgi:hypothetical protein